ncbi:hypothetical protein N9K75_02635 [bacterium]|nr:hypothetical protein [bacterium]
MNASMITNGKRDMDTGDLINTIKKKIKMVDDAKQSVESSERLKFYKIYSRYTTRDELRIYMESRKGTILKDTFMKKATIVRSLYLTWLRSVSIKKIKFDRRIWDVLHTRGLTLKKDIFKGLEENSNYVSDKDRQYIKMVICTIEKYNTQYLDIKTSISVEILRAIRCKYMDRVIMGFL